MFSEDMFDACVIELDQLIMNLDPARIRELWHVSSIDKKSEHFVVLYDNAAHLCTCLTLINRGLVCRHFFATMLISPIAKFHIRLVPQRWYMDSSIMEEDSSLHSEPMISATSDQEFGTVEHATKVDFSHLENIRGHYVFTKEVREEMSQKQQWGRGFGIMKKTLNLAIATGRMKELYEVHLRLAKEMEAEIAGQVKNGESIVEFASTISNPIGIKTKGRKPKEFNHAKLDRKGKKREVSESDPSDKENNTNNESHEEPPCKKPRRTLQDIESNDLIDHEISKSKKRTCGICNEKGHNARTCPAREKPTAS
jgi:hypothetical protein